MSTAKNLSELDADRMALWDTKDAAGFLKVSRSWVYHQAEAGLIPYLRIGSLLRFDPTAIRQFAKGEWRPANVLAMPRRGT